jgi:LPXTG-motif cell wall-anchored protein
MRRRKIMTSRKLLMFAALAAVLMWMPCTTAVAQTIPDQPVYLTFSGPVSVPGHTLPAGKYMFKQSTSKVDRQIIQIYDDKGKSVAMVMAIGAARHDADPVPEKPEVNFYETTPGVAQAIRTWWYPGIRTGGHEFIYPRSQAQQLVKNSRAAVLTTTGEDVESGKLVRTTQGGDVDLTARVEPAPAEPAAAMAPPERAAAPAPAPASSMAMNTAATPAPARRALPKTASEMPLVAAAGFLALFAGVALIGRRRIA